MKNLILKSTMMMAAAALMVSSAFAQSTKVTIPFAFEANGKTMPAGDYVVNTTNRNTGAYTMTSLAAHESVLILERNTIGDARGQVKLVFAVAPDAYYLTEFWDGDTARAIRNPHFKSAMLAATKGATRVEIPGK